MNDELEQATFAYLAGLIDADGTVTLTRSHANKNRSATVTLSNTDKNLLIWVRTTLAAGTISGKKTSKPYHSPSFTWTIRGRQAITLLQQLLPYLQTYKAKRAELIVRDYIRLTPRNGK